MRYNIKNGKLEQVTVVYHDGGWTSNPSDELVDELNAGYPYTENKTPDFNPETEKIVAELVLIDGVIVLQKRVETLPIPDRKTVLNAEIARLDAEYNTWTNEPLEYVLNENETLYIKPIWVSTYYAPMKLLNLEQYAISDARNQVRVFTPAEFDWFYAGMVQKVQERMQEYTLATTPILEELKTLENED